MDIVGFLNILMAAQQRNQRKSSIEIIKDAIDQNNLPKEYNDVLKSIVDLVYAFCEERNYDKAKMECAKLSILIDKYQRVETQYRF